MTNSEKVFSLLHAKGYTVEGICGILGNMSAESGVEAVRLEGDFSAARSKSYDYMKKVDNGLISREQVGKRGTGWGLCQWTFGSRVLAHYDICKKRGKSIGDLETQVDFLDKELRDSFPRVFKACTASNLYDACYYFLMQFENPANAAGQVSYRYNLALGFYDSMKDYVPEEIEEDSCDDDGMREVEPMLDYSDLPILSVRSHDDSVHLAILNQLMYLHGYAVTKTDKDGQPYFDGAAVKSFQTDHLLTADGYVGEKTWKALIESEV